MRVPATWEWHQRATGEMELRGRVTLTAGIVLDPLVAATTEPEWLQEEFGAVLEDALFGAVQAQAEPLRHVWRREVGDTRFDDLLALLTLELTTAPPPMPRLPIPQVQP